MLWGTFDLYNETFWPLGLTGSIGKVLTDVHKKFWQKLYQNSTSPKSLWATSHEKSTKWWVYLIHGTFDIYNGTFWSGSISKFLTDVHENFLQK